MAKHYNKIQVARGNRNSKLPLLGELFYDYDSKSVFIGVAKSGTVPEGAHPYEWKRFGGFDSIVIKGTIGSDAEYAALNGHLLPGDAYIVTAPISVEQKEIIFDGEGHATRGKNYRTYDDFFKAGQIIVYCSENLSSLPNAAVYGTGTAGFIPLSGGQNASDIENDVEFQPVAAAAADPDDTAANATGLNNVQSALDYLFNNKMEYKGEFDTVNFTGTLTKNANETIEDTVVNAIASMQALNPGEWIIYSGPTKTITVVNGAAEETYVLKKNTAIVMSAIVDVASDPTNGDEGGLSKTVSCFPLGAADANDIEFAFTDKRKSTEGTSKVKTKTVAGTPIELDPADSVDGQVDDQVASVTQALDVLHQTKADLNAEGKIPLSQIPNTFVGALQYIGTVNLNGATVTQMTAIEFAEAMAALNGQTAPDSMEKPLEGEEANTQYQRVDAGDYVIVKVSGSTNVSDEAGTTSPRKSQIKVITGSGANDFFLVSEGDHVICNSVTYDDDGDITAVKLDHLDTSSRVDAVNGMTAEVDVVGNIREDVDISKSSTADLNDYPEVVVTNDPVAHQIKITIPNAVLAPSDIAKNAIPVGNGGKELLQSEVSINGQDNASKWHDAANPTHNTELVGKTSANDEVAVEFPDESGKLLVNPEGNGTEDFIPKFDAHGNLIDSDVSQNTAAEKFDIYDKNGNKIVTINYNDLANLINFHRAGPNDTTVEVIRRYDEVDATSGKKFTDVRNYDENTHTTLDDCSTIDGGEWE